MFDFTNYTYSGLLAILATLFALSYPLIISSIERIDSKYNSTLLTARFRKESVFQWFQGLLILNVGITISLPFFMNGCSSTVWIIVMQAIALITVISLVLKLYSLILDYYDPAKLKDKILRDYSNAQKKGKKKREKRYFAQWTELTDTLLKSGDFSLEKSVYDTLGKYRQNFWEKINEQKSDQKDKEKPYDEYFYQAVSKINETLCKNKRQPSTSLSILTYLFPYNNLITFENLFPKDLNIPYTSFRAIWNNIQIQLFYDRDDFIIAYWETASEEVFHRENKSKKRQKELFQEFHIILPALLLQQKKYTLVKQILELSEKKGESYSLIPSNVSNIIIEYSKIYCKIEKYPLYLERDYQMPNTDKGSCNELGALLSYLALLICRFSPQSISKSVVLLSQLTQNELYSWKKILPDLIYSIERVKKERELLAIIGITHQEENTISPLLKELSELLRETKEALSRRIENQEYDETILKTKKRRCRKESKNIVREYEVFSRQKTSLEGYSSQTISYSYANPILNSEFQENAPKENTVYREEEAKKEFRKFRNLFFRTFQSIIEESVETKEEIPSADLFQEFDQLPAESKYTVISFDVPWENHRQREDLKKVSDFEYHYKERIQIIALNGGSPSVYIMKSEDIPHLSFEAPKEEDDDVKKYQLECIDEKYQIYMSVLKLKDNEEIISKEIRENVGEKINQHSLLSIKWHPVLHIKPNVSIDYFRMKQEYVQSDDWDLDTEN